MLFSLRVSLKMGNPNEHSQHILLFYFKEEEKTRARKKICDVKMLHHRTRVPKVVCRVLMISTLKKYHAQRERCRLSGDR